MTQQNPNLTRITHLLDRNLKNDLQRSLTASIASGLKSMLDVFFHPGEASMLRAKTSTMYYVRDTFLLLSIGTIIITGLYTFDSLLTLFINPDPVTPMVVPDLIVSIAITFVIYLPVVAIVFIGVLTQNLITTSILVWLVTRQWHQKRVYLFISVLYSTPFFIFITVVEIFITVLPLFATPYEIVNGERITSVFLTPMSFYLLYLHYQNIRVSFNLTYRQAGNVIFLPLFVAIALVFAVFIGFMLFALVTLVLMFL